MSFTHFTHTSLLFAVAPGTTMVSEKSSDSQQGFLRESGTGSAVYKENNYAVMVFFL